MTPFASVTRSRKSTAELRTAAMRRDSHGRRTGLAVKGEEGFHRTYANVENTQYWHQRFNPLPPLIRNRSYFSWPSNAQFWHSGDQNWHRFQNAGVKNGTRRKHFRINPLRR
jgi:hypothetical protein